ncbi:biotin transporter BioY [Mediterraneibacter agrestimuris]|uniref:biotin transporter BioY n=1 Tax=Mediterraneibacter agrestimuris TaxID=2941333 RepID=UPI00203DB84D|nr:biotin transporter BioY [Mediterraneibacter agrestimuris]
MIKQSKLSVQDICIIAIMTAVTAVLAQISIPLPMMVPMTMQTFAVTLAGILLGAKRGAVSMIIYLLLGAVGAPVFTGLKGGLQSLAGPTGGFLLSFPVMAYIIGKGIELRKKKGMFTLLLIVGTVSNYVVGVAMYCVVMESTVWTAVTACVLPFIPTAVIKAILAAALGLRLRDRLGSVLQAVHS